MGPQKISLKGMAHLWTFVELARDVAALDTGAILRLRVAMTLVDYFLEHKREPDAVLVSRETKRVLVELEEDKHTYQGIEIVIADVPEHTFFFAERAK